MAAALDGEYELVAGAFASSGARSRETGEELRLDPERVYGEWERMVAEEEARDDGIEAVVIVTPNHLHFEMARAFLQAGIHVICDKPLTTSPGDADELCRLVGESGLSFVVTYNYRGYPMVAEARERIAAGALGPLRKVIVEYSQGWLSTLLEAEGQKQAEWRGDPERAGVSSALGDIGTHAFDLLHHMTGLTPVRLFADLGTVVAGRRMEDDATVLMELEGEVRATMLVSQIATGERNHLRIRVYGAEGGLDWCQEEPNRLRLLAPDGAETVLHRGGAMSESSRAATRLPAGHPEGFIEAFANVYRSAAAHIRGLDVSAHHAPTAATVEDGARGVHFVHAAVESNQRSAWVDTTWANVTSVGKA